MSQLRQIMGMPPEKMGPVEDSARSIVSEGANATADLIGGIGETHNRVKKVASYLMQKFGMDQKAADDYAWYVATSAVPLAAVLPDQEQMRGFVPNAIKHEPETWQGDIAGRTAYNIPGAVASGGGSMLNRLLSAGGSAVGGFAGKEGSKALIDGLESWMPSHKDTIEKYRPYIEGGADIAGNIAGSFAPNVAQHMVTPNPMTDNRIRDARILDDHGVEMTAGQRTGNKALHYAESQTGGTAYDNLIDRQNRQYTAGALEQGGVRPRRPGGPRPDEASPEVLNHQHDILGEEFDRLQQHGMQPDTQFFDDLVQLRDDYRATMPARSPGAPLIETTVRYLADRARRGIPVDGEFLRKTGTMLRQKMRSFRASGRADEADALNNLIEAIDNGVERSLTVTNPAEVGAWRDLRTRYRNLITLEEAASNAPNAQLSPADLTRATKATETRKGYSRGFGPFNNYSRAGAEILTEKPNSGTTSRLVAALGGGGKSITAATIGGGIGAAIGGLPGMGIGAAVGASADVIGRFGKNYIRMTPAMQAYLSNQLARGWTPEVGAGRRAAATAVTNSNRIIQEKR